MEFEKAKMLAREAFFSRWAGMELPPWFLNSATICGRKSGKNIWIMSYVLNPFSPLGENQKWEEVRGNKVVVEINPITGQRSMLISRSGPGAVVVFEVEVNLETNAADVRIDIDLTELNGNDFENYC